MQEYPNRDPERSGGSDLPRPRKKPVSDSASEQPVSMPASASQRDIPKPQHVSGVKETAPESEPSVRRSDGQAKSGDDRKNYGRDTMQLRIYPQDTEVDTAFERRRAAPLPPRSSDRKTAEQRQKAAPSQPPRQKAAPSAQQRKKPVQKRPVQQAAPKKKRRRNPVGRLARGITVLAASLFLIYSCAALFMISRLERMPEEERRVTSGTLDASHVTSILLIGTDARDPSERGRSDSMILVSMNSKTQTMYLTSFMRDAYVQIPDHGKDKLNAAYAYGGAELLMDTLELNYGVSVDDCMNVSFSGFAGVIDAFGGVEITMSDAEAQALNEILISEVNELMGDARDADLLDGGGTYRLNGKQALSYSRIRYVGNADFERTSRQREVMTQLFGNLKTRAVTAVPELVSSALPHVGTNMSTGELYLLSLRAPFVLGYDIQQLQIPAEGTWSGQNVNGQSVLVVDFAENTKHLQETVYALT